MIEYLTKNVAVRVSGGYLCSGVIACQCKMVDEEQMRPGRFITRSMFTQFGRDTP